MLQRVLATAILLSSVSFGSLSDIPDIQDPEFSWGGLGLEDVYPDTPRPHIDFFGIKHRSYTANKDFLIGSPEQLVDANGQIKDETFISFNNLKLALCSEAFVSSLIFKHDEAGKYTTPESSNVFKQLFWNRVHLIRAAFTEMIKIVESSVSHSQQTDYTIINRLLRK